MVDDADVDRIVRAVTTAVSQRLGSSSTSPDMVSHVAREVARTYLQETIGATGPTAAAVQHGDGTMTTPLGARVPAAPQSLGTCVGCVEQVRRKSSAKAVVTATGLNRRGVIAGLSACIAGAGGDIEEVSQTIVAAYFTLILIVDLSSLTVNFAEFQKQLQQTATNLGFHVVVMHEDVMRSLQRI